MTVSIHDGYRGFVKVPKYNVEDISDDTIKDCMEMVYTGIEIDKTTGEAIFNNVVGW